MKVWVWIHEACLVKADNTHHGTMNSLPSHIKDVDPSYSGFWWSLHIFVWMRATTALYELLLTVLPRHNLTYLHTYTNSPTNCRGAADPEFCYPAGSGSMPDPDMSDLAGSGSEQHPSHLDLAGSGSSWIRIQASTTADNMRKLTLSAPLLEKLEWLFTLFCDRTYTWVIISVWH